MTRRRPGAPPRYATTTAAERIATYPLSADGKWRVVTPFGDESMSFRICATCLHLERPADRDCDCICGCSIKAEEIA